MTSIGPRPTGARVPFANAAEGDARANDRLQGLNASERAALHQASHHIQRGDGIAAENALRGVLGAHPEHPETLRLYAIVCQLRGRGGEALAAIRHAIRKQPLDPLLMNTLGSLLRGAGDLAGAEVAFRRACELQPDLASAWLNLGTNLQMQADTRQAQAAFARAVECEPGYVMAHVANGNALQALGRIDEAAAQFRAALASDPRAVLAWAGLAEIKTMPLGADDLVALEDMTGDATLGDEERAIAGFALGRGLEDQERYPEAFAAFDTANATMRRLMPWDAAAHSQQIDAIASAFATPPATAHDATLGRDVVFVVSLPRAGSTLAEQILGAHPDVEGAGELNDLPLILQEESQRRGEAFAEWAPKATPDDWQRLGTGYLERTARWRTSHRVHVDKAVFNWPLVGAIAAMLPGAHIVNCRRDPLETAWSCFKQRFVRGQQVFSYALDDIGAYWIDYDRLMFFWHARYPGRIFELV
ncbi:MAG TPA: sulfotransferase, partial [Rhodanobacteraceae bacterium]|nr:sulfotransferase [Rhodanobacteraceae bacterium]